VPYSLYECYVILIRCAIAANPVNTGSTVASEWHDDASHILNQTETLLSLFLTSTTFRLLLKDIFVTAREILADAASQTRDVADVVASGATAVESIARPSVEEKLANPPQEPLPSQQWDERAFQQERAIIDAERQARQSLEESRRRGLEAWSNLQDQSPNRARELITRRIKSVRL
jgi:hypothetical protein